MYKGSFRAAFGFLFFLTLVIPRLDQAVENVIPEARKRYPGSRVQISESGEKIEYQYAFDEGYRDAIEGIRSRCQSKQDCPSQDSYKRGYKLGYKKGMRELKRRPSESWDPNMAAGNDMANEGIRPLIDSPGKTIGSDFNGDGIHDFIVGANFNDDGPGANNAGAAYIFFGASD